MNASLPRLPFEPSLRAKASCFALLIALVASCSGIRSMHIAEEPFGEVDGHAVRLFTLKNANGLTAKITDYGAIVTELYVPDRDGELSDIVLGFDTVEEYVDGSPYFGAIVGRVANRIAGGTFELDGKTYTLAKNNGPHHLHGGVRGLDKVVWKAQAVPTEHGPSVVLTYRSPAGEEGYPGNVDVTVVYTLTDADELVVDMRATTDAPTPVNLAHHSYWNLAGHASGTILEHVLRVDADRYTPGDADLIPTGEIAPVQGTPFDFRAPRAIGADIDRLPAAGDDPGGYDVNYVLRGTEAPRSAARVHEPASGRVIEIETSAPGLQLYSGNFLDGIEGKDGASYGKHTGFCLETQLFPDAIHQRGRPGWPDPILRPGETYHHRMVHRFRTE